MDPSRCRDAARPGSPNGQENYGAIAIGSCHSQGRTGLCTRAADDRNGFRTLNCDSLGDRSWTCGLCRIQKLSDLPTERSSPQPFVPTSNARFPKEEFIPIQSVCHKSSTPSCEALSRSRSHGSIVRKLFRGQESKPPA